MDENGKLEPSNFQPGISSSQGPKTPEAALTLARIVWFAMLVSQGMYLLIGPVLMTGGVGPMTAGEDLAALMAILQTPMGMTGGLVAVSLLMFSFLVPSLLSRTVEPQQNRLQVRLMRFIVSVALNEAVALSGLVFGFIVVRNSFFGSVLIYLSVAAMLARFPSGEMFQDSTGPRSG